MRRVAVLLAILMLPLTGCGSRTVPEKDLLSAIAKSEKLSHKYIYREDVEYAAPIPATDTTEARKEIQAQRNVVSGRVADDLRFAADLSVNGEPVQNVIVSDDALAIKVLDPDRIPGGKSGLSEQILNSRGGKDPDFELYVSLLTQRWVIDYTAAPPVAAPVARGGGLIVGENPILDAAYVFQYIRRSIEESLQVKIYNADAIDYNPADDPWNGDQDADLAAKGITRYDLLPPNLPSRSARGTSSSQPTTPMFRKMALYVRGGRVLKVVEKIDIDGQKDFRRIIDQDRGTQYHRKLLKSVKAGGTRDPLRQRSMSLDLLNLGEKVSIKLPVDEALVGELGQLFGGSAAAAQAEAGT